MPKPYTPNDKWAQRAKAEGFRARSVYKLMELDERFGLLKPKMTVIDIGAAPGSWLQYEAQVVGSSGKILGLDLQPIDHVAKNIVTLECDIADDIQVDAAISTLAVKYVDLILSDIAPNTSGIKDVDQWRSIELSQHALRIAKKWLKPSRGTLVMKIFRGRDFDQFVNGLKRDFSSVKPVTVTASRDRSREVYVVCR